MKKIVAVTLLILIFGRCYSQTWSNAFAVENILRPIVLHDYSGGIYFLGYEEDTLAGSKYGWTGLTVYKIRKYDPSGVKIWEKRLVSSTFVSISNAIFANGQICIGGSFQANLCYDNSCVNSNGGYDIFCLKIATNGSANIRTEGGGGDEMLYGFEADENGNTYYSGRATGQVILGTKNYNTTSQTDFFLMKKDSLHNEVWTKLGKTVPGFYSGVGSVLKSYNYLYVPITGKTVMETTTDTVGCGNSCSIVYKFDLNGNYIRSFQNIYRDYGGGYYISFVDSLDNLYCHNADETVKKINANDSVVWQRSFVSNNHSMIRITNFFGKNSSYYLSGYGFDSISEPTTYLTKGTLTYGSELQTISMPKLVDGFLQDYGNNEFLYSGSLFDSIRFGNQVLNSPVKKGFAAILNWDGITSVHSYELVLKNITVFPNPTSGIITVNAQKSQDIKVSIYDLLGNCLWSKTSLNEMNLKVDLSSQPKGIYVMEIMSEGKKSVSKIVLQ